MQPPDPRDEAREATRRVTWQGLTVGLALATMKVVGGYLAYSQTLVADGVRTLADTTRDLTILLGIYGAGAPTAGHPRPEQPRLDPRTAALLGLVLALVAGAMGLQAIGMLRTLRAEPPLAVALTIAVATLIVQEALYRWTRLIGDQAGASLLIANARHYRGDALRGLPATLAIGGAILLPRWQLLDSVGAIIVCVLILQSAGRLLWPAFSELTRGDDDSDELAQRLRLLAMRVDGVQDAHSVRLAPLGVALQAELCVRIDAELPIHEGHRIANRVRQQLIMHGPQVVEVTVHLEPWRSTPETFIEPPDTFLR